MPITMEELNRKQDWELKLGSGMGVVAKAWILAYLEKNEKLAYTVQELHELLPNDKKPKNKSNVNGWVKNLVAKGMVGQKGSYFYRIFESDSNLRGVSSGRKKQ